MNSLLKAFKEFYNEINGATLTGAIDVIVVEQADGSFVCSPFHVRFGKLGVLRSREKIVDIEVNGEPVNIHMKLGESGEAFFVQECPETDADELPENLATSPLPSEEYASKYNDSSETGDANSLGVKIRRNSTASSPSEKEKVYENQESDYKSRRYSEKVLNRRNPAETKLEYTTERIRQELAEKEALLKSTELKTNSDNNDTAEHSQHTESEATTIAEEGHVDAFEAEPLQTDEISTNVDQKHIAKETESADVEATVYGTKDAAVATMAATTAATTTESKSKKKRRKKSMMKKKASLTDRSSVSVSNPMTGGSNTSRKSSSSSSAGSASIVPSDPLDPNDFDTDPDPQQSSNATSLSIDDLAKSESAVVSGGGGGGGAASTPAATNVDNGSLNNVHTETMDTPRMCDLHFFSDTEVAASPYGSRPSTPIQSDSEFEMSQREKNSDPMTSSTASWKWGEFPITPNKPDSDAATTKDAKQAERNSTLNTMLSFMKETMRMRKSTSDGGVYLSDLMNSDGLDPDVVAKYFPPPKNESFSNLNDGDDHESGNGTSLPHSPSSVENGISKSLIFDFDQDGKFYEKKAISLSLCGGLENNGPTDEEFEKHLIDYADVCQNPSIFMSPLLVVRLCDKYYSWATASSIVMTIIAYRKPLTNDAIEQLMSSSKMISSRKSSVAQKSDMDDTQSKDVENNRQNNGGYSWWKWRRSTDSAEKKSPAKEILDETGKLERVDQRAERIDEMKEVINELDGMSLDNSASGAGAGAGNAAVTPTTVTETNDDELNDSQALNADNTDVMGRNDDSISSELADISKSSFTSEKYRKTLRLTSEQIESLNLKHGMNELQFSVTTAYQGTSRCKCYVFRWKHTDKVVISDIDGTITKSDVLGHILPMVGKDWAQLGVAELFTKIERNGYKLLYLSARAIGQSRATRDYLRSIQQGNVKLPDGPLLLNPTSLISAFHREVIERKPEQFKIACLSDIKALFPENPFYAGYGNRINDVWAYCAVGIPVIRIFTINPKGELKHELNKTFQSTYHSMAYIVDQLFPPVNDREESVEFSSFNFWREPVVDVNCDDLLDVNLLNGSNSNSNSNSQQQQQQPPSPTQQDKLQQVQQVPRVLHTPATPISENELPSILEKV